MMLLRAWAGGHKSAQHTEPGWQCVEAVGADQSRSGEGASPSCLNRRISRRAQGECSSAADGGRSLATHSTTAAAAHFPLSHCTPPTTSIHDSASQSPSPASTMKRNTHTHSLSLVRWSSGCNVQARCESCSPPGLLELLDTASTCFSTLISAQPKAKQRGHQR